MRNICYFYIHIQLHFVPSFPFNSKHLKVLKTLIVFDLMNSAMDLSWNFSIAEQ